MRIKKIKFILIGLCFVNLSANYGQTYNEIITQAYSYAYINNDYEKAAKLFDKAFELYESRSSELYYAAEMNLILENTEKFKQYLSLAVKKGYSNYNFLAKNEKFKGQFPKTDWDSLLILSKRNYAIFEKEYNLLNDSLPNHYHPADRVNGKIDLRLDTLEVKHQGKRNTCSVFAASALMEYLYWNKYKKFINFSESYNYWAAKTFALNNKYLKESYTSVDGLAGYLAVEAYKYGSMDEENWPYEIINWYNKEDTRCKVVNGKHIKECFTGVPPQKSKESGYTAQPVYIDREDIGQFILQEKKPVVMNIFWYFDAVDEKGYFQLPAEKDINKGGHVILLLGYDSEKKTFIFRNSWGKKWGQGGYGIIPEDYILYYYEMAETFPYGIDAPNEEKIQAIKGSIGVSAILDD